MKIGRPKGAKTKPLRRRKGFHVAGRYKERLEKLQIKREKLHTLESLLFTYEKQPNPDLDEIKDLKRRINDIRTQLLVTSTIEPLSKENITR